VLISRSRVQFLVLFAALGLNRFVRLGGVHLWESEAPCSHPIRSSGVCRLIRASVTVFSPCRSSFPRGVTLSCT
jgi:hypothetical protein